MKVVTIFRGNLEIEKFHLLQPTIVIGRSPTNDVVLRAPGVAPIHFYVEWIGTGAFDPAQDLWTISDVSHPETRGGASTASEGHILKGTTQVGDFKFEVRDDALEAKPIIGGAIKGRLSKSPTLVGGVMPSESVLEFVQIRTDSGAVEEILHLPKKNSAAPEPLSQRVPELKLQWESNHPKLLLPSLVGIEVFNRGQRVTAQMPLPVSTSDLLQIRWKQNDFYLRFVPRIQVPIVPIQILRDPLLKKLILLAILLFLLFLALVLIPRGEESKEIPPPPRVAVVEIKTVPDAPPPPPPPPPMETAAPKVEKVKAGIENVPATAKPAPAAKARFKGDNEPRVGLSSPAPVKENNQVGILGVLKGGAKKGPGVRADMVLNQGIVTDSVSSKSGDAPVVVKNPPAGVLGSGRGGDPKARGSGDELVQAQTTFSGGKEYDPSSTGPISRKGAQGTSFEAGSSLGRGAGSGVGSGKSTGTADIGSLDSSNFDVEGGLDKETVRRVIAGYRGRIRVCYERSLQSNPRAGGRGVYRWQISPTGPVTSVVLQSSTLTPKVLETCVLEVIKSMNFPAAGNGRPTVVIYPFVFQTR